MKKKLKAYTLPGRYMSLSDAFYGVCIQEGDKRDNDKDFLIAFCFRPQDARRIKKALEETR